MNSSEVCWGRWKVESAWLVVEAYRKFTFIGSVRWEKWETKAVTNINFLRNFWKVKNMTANHSPISKNEDARGMVGKRFWVRGWGNKRVQQNLNLRNWRSGKAEIMKVVYFWLNRGHFLKATTEFNSVGKSGRGGEDRWEESGYPGSCQALRSGAERCNFQAYTNVMYIREPLETSASSSGLFAQVAFYIHDFLNENVSHGRPGKVF